jgi:hypothetical protein
MTAIKETTVLKCPSQDSFESHKKVFRNLQAIAVKFFCSFEWEILNKKEWTFILQVIGKSKSDQQNALIEIMKYLCIQGIEPADVILIKTEKSDAEIKLLQMQKILKEVQIPA